MRAALLAYTALALAWAALGPLPWLLLPAPQAPHAHHHHATAGAHHPDHADASAIPGSPLHPDDHGCAACQVLQHLARGAPLAVIALPSPPLPVRTFSVVTFLQPSPAASDRSAPPRLRGPPAQIA